MKPPASNPFTPARHQLGVLRGGGKLELATMTPEAAGVLGPAVAAIGPWAHYGFPPALLTEQLAKTSDGAVRYQVLADEVVVGAVLIRSPWLAGPYLQMLALLPPLQGQGAGAAILDWYEQTARAGAARNVWLCVTGVNVRAQRFYQRHGYQLAGTLAGLMRDGDDELLMRKQL
jgi:diamine N-acetyltransferase